MTEISNQLTLENITEFLLGYQPFWRFDAFQRSADSELPWLQSEPQLCEWLQSLSPEQIEAYKDSPDQLNQAISACIPALQPLLNMLTLPTRRLSGLRLSRGLDSGIPGRKLQQILAMSELSLVQHAGSEWLEWCAGKGYLGRILAQQSSQPVTSLEWQQALCDAGQQEADQQKLPMRFVQGDALAAETKALLNPRQHAVALHACGDLHVQLIKNAVEQRLPAITLSPCCYHLIQGECYQPLSHSAADSGLTLSKAELRIPLQELVTGGARVRKHRQQEMTYRLGLDLLLSAQPGAQGYISVPSIKKSQLADGFTAFCRWAAEQRGFTLPDVDFSYWQQRGEQRFWQMERLSLVQQFFRRPLELWLVLDRVLFLQEYGYRVTLSEFCPRSVTPRNILIHAEWQEKRGA